MSSKAYRIPSAIDRLRKQQIQIREMQALQRNRNTPRPVASTAFAGTSAAGSTGGGTGNFLRTEGDTMIGPLALAPPVDFSVDIDADGILDIGESSSNSQYSSNIQIEDVPTSTTLDTIAGAAFDGQILVIRTFAPNPITIAQATLANGGNIQTPNDADFIIGDLQMISLVFDAALIVFANTGGTWRVLTGDTTGGGGVSFPIQPPIDNRGSVSTDQVFDLSNTTGHVLKLEAAGDFNVTFSVFPANDIQQEWEVEILQDATGGRVVSFPQVINPPVLDTTPDSTTIIVFRTNDNGSTIRVGNTVTTTGGITVLSQLTIDVNKDWLAMGISNFGTLTGVTGITMTGATATLQGVNIIDLDGSDATIVGAQLIDLFQADQQIESLSTGIEYSVGDLQSHLFKSLTDDIAQFEEAAAGVFRLNMFDHAVRDARDVTFSNASGAAIFAGTSPAIGYDSVEARLLINMPTGGNLFVTNNNVIGTTQINNNSLAANIINANDVLQLGVDVTVPTVTGEFRSDGTDVFVFTGGVVKNLTDIGSGTGSQTPWLSDIDGDGFFLQDVGGVEFRDNVTLPGSGIDFIAKELINLIYNTGGTDGHIFRIAGSQVFGLGVTINNSFNTLDLNSNKITDLLDPTAAQDAATKAYVDSQTTFDGVQDAEIWLDHETAQYNFEVYHCNCKSGSTLSNTYTMLEDNVNYVPIFLGERARLVNIAVDFSTGGTGTYDLTYGIYSRRTFQNYPETLIASNTGIFTGTGVKSMIFTEDLEAGMYFLAVLVTSADSPVAKAASASEAVVLGFQDQDSPDEMNALYGYTTPAISLASTAPDDLLGLSGATISTPPVVFARFEFNPN